MQSGQVAVCFRRMFCGLRHLHYTSHLPAIGLVPIRRHVKIRSEANPFNPDFDKYFEKRRKNLRKISAITHQKTLYLANKTIIRLRTTTSIFIKKNVSLLY